MSLSTVSQTYFADSSAIAKRYALEIGSNWIVSLCAPENLNIIAIANVAVAEVAAALSSKFRGGFLSRELYDRAFDDLIFHARTEYWVTEVNRAVVESAARLTRKYKLRGYDAVQLSSALYLNQALVTANRSPLTLISADDDLLVAARVEGLLSANPNAYS